MKKKVLTLLFVLMMVLGLSVVSFAETVAEPLVSIGSVEYTDLPSALKAVKDGDTITLLRDIVVSTPTEATKKASYTIDLNGHTIDCGKSRIFNFGNASSVTFKNGTINAASPSGGALVIRNTVSSFKVEGITFTGTGKALYLVGNTKVDVVNCTGISEKQIMVCVAETPASVKYSFNHVDSAEKLAAALKIAGDVSIQLSGNVEVSSVIEATSAGTYVIDLNGYTLSNVNGSRIMNLGHSKNASGAVTIKNGTIKAENPSAGALVVRNTVPSFVVEDVSFDVTGKALYLAGSTEVDAVNCTGLTEKGIVIVVGDAPATVKYTFDNVDSREKLAAALNVGGDTSIQLSGDISVSEAIDATSAGTYVIDLNGHTLSNTSNNRIVNFGRYNIIYTDSVTIKNGTVSVNGTDSGAFVVRNTVKNFSVENVAFTGIGTAVYVADSVASKVSVTDNAYELSVFLVYNANENGTVTVADNWLTVDSYDDLAVALRKGIDIRLTGDVVFDAENVAFEATATGTYTLDLNGYKIDASAAARARVINIGKTGAEEKANVTVKNGKIVANNPSMGSLVARNNVETLTVDNVSFDCGKGFAAIGVVDKEVTVVTIEKCSFLNGTKPFGEVVASIGDTQYVNLLDAIEDAQPGDIIKLEADLELSYAENSYTEYNLPENAVLDLNQKTLTITNNAAVVFQGKNITIKNGNISSLCAPAGYALYLGNSTLETSVTVDGVSMNGGVNAYVASVVLKNMNIDASSRKYYAVWADQGATIVIDSGSYTGGTLGAVVNVTGSVVDDFHSTIDIRGGSFTGALWTSNPVAGVDYITVTGGTFTVDPSAYVVPGYLATEQDGVWTVAVREFVTITLVNADGKNETTTETVSYGKVVSVYATGSYTVDDITYVFKGWSNDGGETLIENAGRLYSFKALDDYTLTAVYEEAEKPAAQALLFFTASASEDSVIHYEALWNVEGYKMKEAGILYVTSKTLTEGKTPEEIQALLVRGGENVKVGYQYTGTTPSYGIYFDAGVGTQLDRNVYARAYVVFVDSDGAEHILYSDMIAETYNQVKAAGQVTNSSVYPPVAAKEEA